MNEQIMLPGVDRLPVIRPGYIYLRYDPVKKDWHSVIDNFLKMNPWFDHSQKTIVCLPLGGKVEIV